MSRRLGWIAAGLVLLAAGCESVTEPTPHIRPADASFDRGGGTLGSGYGTMGPNADTTTTTSATTDTTGRGGGTLGSGY